jgi:hypothetical protein
MAEEGEDVKPKIDLTINYDAQGQSQHTCPYCSWCIHIVGHLISSERSFSSRSVHGQSEIHNSTEEGFRSGGGMRS